jgi:hypothetical protein
MGVAERLGAALRQGRTRRHGRLGGRDAGGHALRAAQARNLDVAKDVLHAFLASFGIGAGDRRDRQVARLLPGVRARRRAHPDEDPREAASLHAEQAFEAWLAAVLGSEIVGDQPALPIGRAAFLACDGAARWADLILIEDGLPEAFIAAMRAAAPAQAPAPMPGAMAAQSLESWTFADAGRAAFEVVDANLGWLGQARPLIAVPIRLGRRGS